MRPQGWQELHETPTNVLVDLIAEIVTVEGPVHVDEVTVRSSWNLQRSGGRIQSAVENAITHAVQTKRVELQGQFVSVPGAAVKVRDRSRVNSANLRKPEMLPPQEVKEGVLQVVRTNFGGSQDELTQVIARLLGFRVTSAQLREVIQSAISELVADGKLIQQGTYLVPGEPEAVQSAKQ